MRSAEAIRRSIRSERAQGFSGCALLLDVIGQRAQAAEDALVVGIVRAQLESIAFGHRKRELERVDRIEAEVATEQRSVGVDRFRLDPVDIQALHDELGELVLGRCLCGGGRIHLQATCAPLWGGKKAAQCIIRAAAHPARRLRESVSQLFVPSVLPERSAALPPLRIGYERTSAEALLAQEDVLAVIGFDSTSARLNDPRYFQVGLEIVGDPIVEVWRGNGAVRHGQDGLVRWSGDGDYGFFAIEIEESAADGITTAAEHAYRDLTAVIHASATPHVLRLWNYFDAINLGDGDDERYRHFCVGRARAMASSWQDRYPAATAIGRRDGARVLQVYALAARRSGVPVENPRQVNAWRYPREYGPTPPTFARGMTTPAGQLLISGTAAVVGAKSRHVDDVMAQLDETLANIASLIGTASVSVATAPGAGSLLKVYVRDRADAALIAERLRRSLGEIDGMLILNGDICRRELLVEIDGLHI